MILFRYFFREIFSSTLAVTLILLVVIVSSRFSNYLDDAVAGRISADVLFAVMALRIPVILELLLPLSFFIALLFALGRLYVESEMAALSACGFSRRRLLLYVLGPGAVVASLVAGLSIWVSPTGLDYSNSILEQERARSDFETITPGEFQVFTNANTVVYAEGITEDKEVLLNIFAAAGPEEFGEVQESTLITAQSADQHIDEQTGQKYFRVHNGIRTQGAPGVGEYQILEFETYAQAMEEPRIRYKSAYDRMGTIELWRASEPEASAALHWRLGLPLLVLVLALVAVPLSHTNPRTGRYAKMIPAILFYMVYLVGLNAVRGKIEDGDFGPPAYWATHGAVVLLGVFLFNTQGLRRFFAGKKSGVGHAAA